MEMHQLRHFVAVVSLDSYLLTHFPSLNKESYSCANRDCGIIVATPRLGLPR